MKNNTTRKRAPRKRASQKKPLPPLTPTINYDGFLLEFCRRINERNERDYKRGSRQVPFNKEAHFKQSLEPQREQLEGWLALGNALADVLENPDTPTKARHTLEEELMEMADNTCVFINDPVVLRLLYPLVRYRALYGFKSVEGKGGTR